MTPTMNAYLIRGKNKGKVVEVSQWCNDWFSLVNGDIVSPLSLVLSPKSMLEVMNHKNNGVLFRVYESVGWNGIAAKGEEAFLFTFKKRKLPVFE